MAYSFCYLQYKMSVTKRGVSLDFEEAGQMVSRVSGLRAQHVCMSLAVRQVVELATGETRGIPDSCWRHHGVSAVGDLGSWWKCLHFHSLLKLLGGILLFYTLLF